jgi:hypothetical protein
MGPIGCAMASKGPALDPTEIVFSVGTEFGFMWLCSSSVMSQGGSFESQSIGQYLKKGNKIISSKMCRKLEIAKISHHARTLTD